MELVEAFDTGSEYMRPLFAGTGGAELLRGNRPSVMTQKEMETRNTRAVVDLFNYFNASKKEGENIADFVKRRTIEFLLTLNQQTEQGRKEPISLATALYKALKRIHPKRGANALETIATLGFTHRPQPGGENDCAIETIYDQLTQVYDMNLGDFTAFRDHIRKHAALPFGTQIDLVNNGQALLNAVQSYLVTRFALASAPSLIIDMWSAVGDGSVMEFQDVAQAGGANGTYILTFYYNGVNHFDSLIGGLARK